MSAKLVSLATEVSYAKSAQFGAVDAISRQSVRNKILKLGALEIDRIRKKKSEM